MTLEFSRKLYSLEAVSAARDAYNEFARFSIEEKGEKIIVTIDGVTPEIEPSTLCGEFGNQVLSEMA